MNPLSRREAIQRLAALGASVVVKGERAERLTWVIRNGRVFLSTSATAGVFRKTNVGIAADGTLRLSDDPLTGERELDATGKIVAPGFIDLLADDSFDPEHTYSTFEKYKLTDGLTTVFQLHGGADNPTVYHQYFDRLPHYTNFGVGIFVMRIRNAFPRDKDRFQRVEQMLEEGALAVCHSPEYQPTPYPELREYARLARKYNRPLFLHLRYSSREHELDGVREGLQLARETGVRVHLNHLNSTGGTYHMPEALDLIAQARATGLEVTCCVYPYSYWATYVHSKRFDPGWRERYGLSYQDLTLVGTNQHLTEQRFNQLRRGAGHLVAVPEGTMPFKTTVDLALQTDFCLIGSDGGIISQKEANSHPRGAGCFSATLRHALDLKFPLEKMLPKITSLPAQVIRPALYNRGQLKTGYRADITIFDPQTVRDRATVANPNQFSEGIEAVFVNGQLAYQHGQLLAQAGQPIRVKRR